MKAPKHLWFILGVALILRLLIITTVGDIALTGDEIDFNHLALQLLTGDGFGYGAGDTFTPTSYRPPGQPTWLAILYTLTGGENHTAARIMQSVFMVGVAGVYFYIGKQLFNEQVALWTAVFIAFDPMLMAFSTWLWAEPLAMLLSSIAMWLLLARSHADKQVMLAGILWGLATLTKESGLLLIIPIALWLKWTRQQWMPAILFFIFSIMTIAPWTLRNYRAHGQFVPVTSVSGLALWLGNNPWGTWPPVFARYYEPDTEIEREALAIREALTFIRDSQPLWLPKKLVKNLPAFLGPENFLLRHLRNGVYGDISPVMYGVIYVGTLLAWVGVGSAGLVGLWLATTNRQHILLILPVWALLVSDIMLHAHSRHRIVILPILALYAAWTVLHGRFLAQTWREQPGWRLVGLTFSLLLFFFLNIPFKQTIWTWLQQIFA